jgi:hypothetical protein
MTSIAPPPMYMGILPVDKTSITTRCRNSPSMHLRGLVGIRALEQLHGTEALAILAVP